MMKARRKEPLKKREKLSTETANKRRRNFDPLHLSIPRWRKKKKENKNKAKTNWTIHFFDLVYNF